MTKIHCAGTYARLSHRLNVVRRHLTELVEMEGIKDVHIEVIYAELLLLAEVCREVETMLAKCDSASEVEKENDN